MASRAPNSLPAAMDGPVCLIVNPHAGAGRALKLLPGVEAELRSQGWQFRVEKTTSMDHARELARVCDVPELPQSAVVSVILGEPEVALAAATACLDAGVRVGCFRPPTVPAGTSRLRLSARASLDAAELDVARRVLTDVLSVART